LHDFFDIFSCQRDLIILDAVVSFIGLAVSDAQADEHLGENTHGRLTDDLIATEI
jgi:hypothetical protein